MREAVVYNKNFKTGEYSEKHIAKDGIRTRIEIDVIDNKTGEVVETAYTENDVNYNLFNSYHYGYKALCDQAGYNSVKMDYPSSSEQATRLELWNSEDVSPEQMIFKREIIGWCGKETTYSGSDSCKGSYNTVESKTDFQTQSRTYVYDWPTHAANGTFNTICFTPTLSDWAAGLAQTAYYKQRKTYYIPFQSQHGCEYHRGMRCLIRQEELPPEITYNDKRPNFIFNDNAVYLNYAIGKPIGYQRFNYITHENVHTGEITGISQEDLNYGRWTITYDYNDGYVYVMFFPYRFYKETRMNIYRIDMVNNDMKAELVASPRLMNCLDPQYTYGENTAIHRVEWFNGLCKLYHSHANGNAECVFDPYSETLFDSINGEWGNIRKFGKIAVFNMCHVFDMETMKMDLHCVTSHVRLRNNYAEQQCWGQVENNRGTIIQWDFNTDTGYYPRNAVIEFSYSGVFSLAKLNKPVTKTPDNTLKVKYTFFIDKALPKINIKYGDSIKTTINKERSEKIDVNLAVEKSTGFDTTADALTPKIKSHFIYSESENENYSKFTLNSKDDDAEQAFVLTPIRCGNFFAQGVAAGIDISHALVNAENPDGWYFSSRYHRYYKTGIYVEKEIQTKIRFYWQAYYNANGAVYVYITQDAAFPDLSSDENRYLYMTQNSNGQQNKWIDITLKPGMNYIHCYSTADHHQHYVFLHDINLAPYTDKPATKAILMHDGNLVTREIVDTQTTLKAFNTRYIRATLEGGTKTTSSKNLQELTATVNEDGVPTKISLNKKAWSIMPGDYDTVTILNKVTNGSNDDMSFAATDSITVDLEKEYNLDSLRCYFSGSSETVHAKVEVSNDLKNWYIVKHSDNETFTFNQGEISGGTLLKRFEWGERAVEDIEAELESYGTPMMTHDAKEYLTANGGSVDIIKQEALQLITEINYEKEQAATFKNYVAPSGKFISDFSLETTCHSKSLQLVVSFDNGETWQTLTDEGQLAEVENTSYQGILEAGFFLSDKRKLKDYIAQMEEKPTQLKIKIIARNFLSNEDSAIHSITYHTK